MDIMSEVHTGKSKDAWEFSGLGGHLKARCVQPGEDMVPPGEQGADYRTLFRRSCDQPEVRNVCVVPQLLMLSWNQTSMTK